MRRTPLVAVGSAVLILGTLTPITAHADPVTITGTVTANGTGVADVEVDFGTTETTTDSTGAFSLDVDTASVSTGWLRIGSADRSGVFTAADGSSYVTAVVGAGGAQAAAPGLVQPLTASALPGLGAVHVALDATGSISGSNPSLANVYVSASDPIGSQVAGEVLVGSSGSYTLSKLAPGTYEVDANGGDMVPASAAVEVRAGQTATFSPSLVAFGRLKGKVTVNHKAPGVRLPVSAQIPDRIRTDVTAKSGTYSIDNLTTGTYTARYGAYGTGSAMAGGKWIPQAVKVATKVGRTTTKNVDLKVGGVIALTIKKPAGAKSVSLSVRKGKTIVAQRHLAFGKKSSLKTSATGLATGTYTVSVATDAGRMAVSTVSVKAAKTKKLSVSKYPKSALTLKGTVPEVTSGTVVLFPSDPADSWTVKAKVSGGAYAIKGLVPDEYSAWAYGPGRRALDAIDIKLTSSRTLVIHAGAENGTVSGTFTLDGVPTALADVQLKTTSGREGYGYLALDADGRVTGTDNSVDAGTYSIVSVTDIDGLTIPLPHWLSAPGSITVPAGGHVDLGTVALEVRGG